MSASSWRRWTILAATLPTIFATPVAAANRDLDEGWLLSPRATAALCAGRVAGPYRCRTWALLGTGRLYGMPELPLSGAAAGFAVGCVRASLDWHRLGSGLYVEDRRRIALILPGDPEIEVVGGWDTVRVGDCPFQRPAAAIRGGIRLGAGIRLSVRQALTEPPPWHGGRGRYGWAALGWSDGGRAATLAFDRETDGPLRLQAEVWTRPVPGFAVGWRIDPATGTLGWVTALGRGRLLLRSSHLVHPELGVSHRWQLRIGARDAAP